MSWQKRIRMRIGYRFLGNRLACLWSKPRLSFLKNKVPPEFLGREISDLGCGDGFMMQKIGEILKAKKIRGYEMNKYLIKRARRKGLHIEKTNLENQVPKGELAVVWGVTHHLTNQKAFLEKVRSHFKYIIIREPIKNIWSFLDGGEPLTEKEWTDLFNETLGHYTLLKSKGCLFVFWKKQNSS